MPEYAYSAYQSPETRIDGRVTAESESAAAQSLLQRGLQPVEIRAVGTRVSPLRDLLRTLSFRRHLGNRERARLARQLGDLAVSGMPMLDALILLERQTESPRLSEALLVMQAAVRDGRSLSEAMGSLPKDFSKVHVSLVRAGEGTGLLSVVLGQVAALEEREQELKTRVRAALMYPTITAIVGLATILVILSFVVPRLSSIFEEMDQALPLITRVLLLLSSVAQWIWTYALVFILAGLLALGFLPKSRRWSLFKDRFLLRLPRLGHLIMTMQVARFAGILGALLRNGVAMVPALGVTAETLDSRVVRSKLRSAVRRVNQGERLGVALEKERVLPQVVTGMITVGESTGNLETTLGRISESSTREAERMVRTLVGLVEPSLIILMGLFVAFIVAAVIIPIFQVNLAM